jgi:hypothetical protein
MSLTTVKTASGRLVIKTGSEGPRHDPYGYTETTVERNGVSVTLHEGLGTWLEIGDRMVTEDETIARDFFETHVGYTPEKIQKFIERARSRCRSCGGREFRCERGYPGETFSVCVACGDIIASSFNEGAVI